MCVSRPRPDHIASGPLTSPRPRSPGGRKLAITARVAVPAARSRTQGVVMKKAHAIVAVLCAAVTGDAFAGTTTQDILVSANVNKACTFTVAPVAFGTYDPYGADVQSTNPAGFTA